MIRMEVAAVPLTKVSAKTSIFLLLGCKRYLSRGSSLLIKCSEFWIYERPSFPGAFHTILLFLKREVTYVLHYFLSVFSDHPIDKLFSLVFRRFSQIKIQISGDRI